MGGPLIIIGSTYTILDTRSYSLKSRVGCQILVSEILDADGDWVYVRGPIERHRSTSLWCRLGAPRVGLCRCPYMSFPHKRTSKCQDLPT